MKTCLINGFLNQSISIYFFLLLLLIKHKFSSSGGEACYIPGGGNIYGAIADMISSLANRYTQICLFSPAFAGMDKQVIKWLCETVGYTNSLESGGILVSGGTMANFMSVLCGRKIKLHIPENYPKGIVYCSDQTHCSFFRACDLAGIPKSNIRIMPTNIQGNFETDFQQLECQIQKDIEEKAGIPFFMICNIGTTNTGKIENIDEFLRISKKYNLWAHADGCYGACFTLLEDYKTKYFSNLGKFDSISVDPHKGFFVSYGLGAILVQDWRSLFKTFSYKSEDVLYYPATSTTRESNEEKDDYLNNKLMVDMFEMGIENTRDFKALKLWLPLKIVGTNTYKKYLTEKVNLASYFAKELKKLTFIQIISQNLTITTFRYYNDLMEKSFEELNEINKDFLTQINSIGNVIISQTFLKSENSSTLIYVCRCCILNVRTHYEEVQNLIKNIQQAAEIIKEAYFSNNNILLVNN